MADQLLPPRQQWAKARARARMQLGKHDRAIVAARAMRDRLHSPTTTREGDSQQRVTELIHIAHQHLHQAQQYVGLANSLRERYRIFGTKPTSIELLRAGE